LLAPGTRMLTPGRGFVARFGDAHRDPDVAGRVDLQRRPGERHVQVLASYTEMKIAGRGNTGGPITGTLPVHLDTQ
jgi:hypothetical protein